MRTNKKYLNRFLLHSNKKAALEMSVGTIVTIVLMVSMLVLGIILIKNIFNTANSVVTLTDQQLKSELSKLFAQEYKVVIYPESRRQEIFQDQIDGVGVGIKNLIEGTSKTNKFAYVVSIADPDLEKKCGVSEKEAEDWIDTGRTEDSLIIPAGDFVSRRVLFNIPVGSPLCTIRYKVDVTVNGQPYANDYFDITIKAKR